MKFELKKNLEVILFYLDIVVFFIIFCWMSFDGLMIFNIIMFYNLFDFGFCNIVDLFFICFN